MPSIEVAVGADDAGGDEDGDEEQDTRSRSTRNQVENRTGQCIAMSQPRRVAGQPGQPQGDGPATLRIFACPETLSCIAGPSPCGWPVADCAASHLGCRAIVSSFAMEWQWPLTGNALRDVRASLICIPRPAPLRYSGGRAGSSRSCGADG